MVYLITVYIVVVNVVGFKMDKLKIFTDGGARGNPGEAAIGIVFFSDSKKIHSHKECIGKATNNVAEYKAVITALKVAKEKFSPQSIEINLDSELVTRQLNGEYKVKDTNLKELFYEARELVLGVGGRVVFRHVRREQNQEADKLVNLALDRS